MLLQALHSCRGARFVCCPPRLPPQQFQPHTRHLQQQPMAPQASKTIEVLAAAEATAAELQGLRLDAALLLLFPDRWKSSTGKLVCMSANQTGTSLAVCAAVQLAITRKSTLQLPPHCCHPRSCPYPALSRPGCCPTALKKVVRRGEVLVNGQVAKTDDTVKLGDRVEVTTRVGCAGTVSRFKREQLRRLLPGLDVAWEDDHMAVVIKPQVGVGGCGCEPFLSSWGCTCRGCQRLRPCWW